MLERDNFHRKTDSFSSSLEQQQLQKLHYSKSKTEHNSCHKHDRFKTFSSRLYVWGSITGTGVENLDDSNIIEN